MNRQERKINTKKTHKIFQRLIKGEVINKTRSEGDINIDSEDAYDFIMKNQEAFEIMVAPFDKKIIVSPFFALIQNSVNSVEEDGDGQFERSINSDAKKELKTDLFLIFLSLTQCVAQKGEKMDIFDFNSNNGTSIEDFKKYIVLSDKWIELFQSSDKKLDNAEEIIDKKIKKLIKLGYLIENNGLVRASNYGCHIHKNMTEKHNFH